MKPTTEDAGPLALMAVVLVAGAAYVGRRARSIETQASGRPAREPA